MSGGIAVKGKDAEGYHPACTSPGLQGWARKVGGYRVFAEPYRARFTLDGVGAAGPAFRVRDVQDAKQSPLGGTERIASPEQPDIQEQLHHFRENP
jgi:hypothetical protein